jgi:hypothetical protein
MLKKVVLLLALAGGLVSCQAKKALLTPGLEDHLFGVTLGCDVAALEKAHTGLYVHKFSPGDVLHEAGNQKAMEVFTFSEEAWSPGRITLIAVRKETDVSVLRDSTGQLPDLSIDPSTPRGLKLGDTRATVIQKYGQPSEERSGMLVFRGGQPGPEKHVDNLQLFVELQDDKVVSIALGGDVPGVKKP